MTYLLYTLYITGLAVALRALWLMYKDEGGLYTLLLAMTIFSMCLLVEIDLSKQDIKELRKELKELQTKTK